MIYSRQPLRQLNQLRQRLHNFWQYLLQIRHDNLELCNLSLSDLQDIQGILVRFRQFICSIPSVNTSGLGIGRYD
jgi:hypothetical protein